jgi:AraC-like DNA-binding protein
LKVWRFTTESFPPLERHQAWQDAMKRLYLPVGDLPENQHFHGSVSCHVSPLGMEFALIDAAGHEISGKYLEQPNAIWLVLILEGRAQLIHDNNSFDLQSGDIAYGPCRTEATMRFPIDFRVLHVRIPRLTLSPRVIAPLSLKIGHLNARTGIDHIFAGMLRALAETLEDITSSQLRPVELALTEFLITSLGGEKTVFGLGGAAGARASHLHRICQSIETMLSDPALNLNYVAQVHGVSTRYLQKLFTGADMSFSQYLRSRRLDRCRADLISPLHSQLSISEICFRWGFNGSAHFSRVFRNKYDISPREYRRNNGQAVQAD